MLRVLYGFGNLNGNPGMAEFRNDPKTYGRVTQAIHWSTTLLVFLLLPLGIVMTRLPDSADPTVPYRIHVAIGLVVLLLTLVRVIWRFMDTHPKPLVMPEWRRKVFVTINAGLYLGLIAVVVTGLAMLIGSGMVPFPTEVTPDEIENIPPRTAHKVLAWLFGFIVLSHLAGVVSYQLKKGDTLGRMLPGRRDAPSK